MTEYHNSEGEGKGKVSLMYSYYRKYIHRSYIPFTTNVFIGINIDILGFLKLLNTILKRL